MSSQWRLGRRINIIDNINSSTWIICVDASSQTGSGSTRAGWEKPLSHRDAALTPQQRFINSLPLVTHTEPSTTGVKMNTESCAAAPKERWQYTPWWWRRCVSEVPPPSVLTCEPFIMFGDWEPGPLNILEREKVTFFTLYYIIAISKQVAGVERNDSTKVTVIRHLCICILHSHDAMAPTNICPDRQRNEDLAKYSKLLWWFLLQRVSPLHKWHTQTQTHKVTAVTGNNILFKIKTTLCICPAWFQVSLLV